jgi:hypothetical protein
MRPKSKGRILPIIGGITAAVAIVSDDHVWIVAATFLAGGTLVAYLIIEFVLPAWRRRRLKHPCEVHFNVPGRHEGVELTYAVQDDRTHHVDELVLPANSEVAIEIIYLPKLPFYESMIAFGCEGNIDDKPYAIECFNRFNIKGKSRWVPGEDDGNKLTRQKYYHIDRNEHRNIGTHRVVGYKLKTGSAGVFETRVFFMTDETEGRATLTIRVEDEPKTLMRCKLDHWDCYVYPSTQK